LRVTARVRMPSAAKARWARLTASRAAPDGGSMLKWFAIAAAVIVFDQATKLAAEHWLEFQEPVALIPFVNLSLSYNAGAAFSFLSDAGGWQRWFFVALAVVVSAAVAVWLSRLEPGERW